jgi:hypothetical protein
MDTLALYRGFVTAMLFCGVLDDAYPDEGNTGLVESDLSPKARRQLEIDCQLFAEVAASLVGDVDDEEFGRNFYYSREGHGTGFWDLGLGECGERLHALATSFPQCEPYVAGGRVYINASRLAQVALFRDPPTEVSRYQLW